MVVTACWVGWGGVGWDINVIFECWKLTSKTVLMLHPSRRQVSSKTLLMLRSSCLQISSRRSWCYALDVFKYLQDALDATLLTSSSNFSDGLDATLFKTSLPCTQTLDAEMTWICYWGNGNSLLAKSFTKTKSMPRHCAPFLVICPRSLAHNALITIGAVSKNLLALLSLAKWRDNLVQSFTQRSMCLWSNGCTECGLSLLPPKMCIQSWLKSWNERKTSTSKCETWNEKSK